ncbi:MAG TPA: hypothetical protein VJ728_08925, partial [Candidatus Binataceae bacterium]|nr:hypothetical protein [Candidatus Binataceae bacterium]
MRIPKAVKTFIKTALRPLRPVRSLILRPVEPRLAALEAHLTSLIEHVRTVDERLSVLEPFESRLSAIETSWRQNLPAFLNAVSSVGAFGYELSAMQRDTNKKLDELWQAAGNANKEIGQIWQRIEFVRREILYEFKY